MGFSHYPISTGMPMRYLYALFVLFCCTNGFSQQQNNASNPTAGDTWQWVHPITATYSAKAASRSLFFSENFQAVTTPALPNGWTTSGLGPTDFYTGTAGTNVGQANEGGFWPVPGHTIFAMTNDDVCSCNKTVDYLNLPPLDFSGETNMGISFEAYFDGNAGSTAIVEVSTNGGANWTLLFPIPARAGIWQRFRHIPLTGTDNESNVLLRFHYNDQLNATTGLAIDDVEIDPIPDHNLRIEEVFYNQTNDPGQTTYYTQVPVRQAKAEELNFAADISNRGVVNQQNVSLGVTVSGPGTYADQIIVGGLAPGNSLPINLNFPGFTPAGIGTYDVTFQALSNETDQEAEDNQVEATFDVTPTSYARDNGTYNGNGFWYGPGNYRVGNRFEIHTLDTLTGIAVFFQENTTPGSTVHVRLYDGGLTNPIASVLSATLSTSDIGSWVNFPLSPTQLAPGDYVAVVEVLSGQVFMAADPSAPLAPPQTTMRFVGGNWSSHDGPIPFIRLEMQPFNDPCPVVFAPNITPVSCFGANDGSIKITPNSGSSPFVYQWSNGGSGDSIGSLTPGIYQLTVSYDSGACSQQSSFSVFGPDSLQVQFATGMETCGDEGGSANALVSGGTPPLAYQWTTGDSVVLLQGISIGTYTVTVTDVNGCNVQGTTSVSGTPGVVINSSDVPPGCGQSNGDLIVTPTSGPAPYSFAWSHDVSLTDSAATSLSAGSYTVTVSDGNGCTAPFTLFLNNQGSAALSTSQVTNVDCFGANTGGIDLNVSGGSTPYTYLWSDPNATTTQNLSNATAGIYRVTVTDANGCQSFHLDTILEPEMLSASFTAERALCFGDNSGLAVATASGGTPGYSYSWSNGSSSDSLLNVSGGNYTVTVTDNQGCEVQLPVLIPQPDSIQVAASVTGEDTLTGGNGSIDITVSGGSQPYSYFWSNNSFGEDLFNLSGGGYWVIITDAEGCMTDTVNFFVPYPTSILENQIPSIAQRVFPNPSGNFINIEWADATIFPVQVSMITITGKVVVENTIIDSSDGKFTRFDLVGPQPGVYLLRFHNEQGLSIHRIIVQ